MDRMVVAVFDNATKANEGKTALLQLDREGEITLYGCGVVLKHADATASVIESDDVTPTEALIGSALGSLIALLGGPTSAALSAFATDVTDLDNCRVGVDFLNEIAAVLTPNRVAVVAEVDEEATEAVDTQIEASGGIVCRRALTRGGSEYGKRDIEAMKADLAQLKNELVRAWSERQDKMQKKIDQLETHILAQMEASDRRRDAAEKRNRINGAVLRKNAAAAGRAIRTLANTNI